MGILKVQVKPGLTKFAVDYLLSRLPVE